MAYHRFPLKMYGQHVLAQHFQTQICYEIQNRERVGKKWRNIRAYRKDYKFNVIFEM